MRCEYVSTPIGGSSPRTPRKRRKSASASPRTAVTPPATTATIAGERERRRRGCKAATRRRARRRPRRARALRPPRPTRRGRVRGHPAASATTKRPLAGISRLPAAIPAAASARATAAERGEVVVAEERRLPPAGVPRSEDVDAEELQEGDGDRDGGPSTSPPSTIVRSVARRTSNGTASARSPYSTSFRKLTRWSSKSASSRETGRKAWNASHARRAAPAEPERRARPEAARARVAIAATRRGDHDDQHGDVGQTDVDCRRTRSDSEIGLVALVRRRGTGSLP